jgi:hypothetical protein
LTYLITQYRHGEARSAVAIQGAVPLDDHAPSGLAMTIRGRVESSHRPN